MTCSAWYDIVASIAAVCVPCSVQADEYAKIMASPQGAMLRIMRPKIEEKVLEPRGLLWEDIQPFLPLLTDEEKATKLMTEPEEFAKELWESDEDAETRGAVKNLLLLLTVRTALPRPSPLACRCRRPSH